MQGTYTCLLVYICHHIRELKPSEAQLYDLSLVPVPLDGATDQFQNSRDSIEEACIHTHVIFRHDRLPRWHGYIHPGNGVIRKEIYARMHGILPLPMTEKSDLVAQVPTPQTEGQT